MNHNKEACRIKGCGTCDTTAHELLTKINTTNKEKEIAQIKELTEDSVLFRTILKPFKNFSPYIEEYLRETKQQALQEEAIASAGLAKQPSPCKNECLCDEQHYCIKHFQESKQPSPCESGCVCEEGVIKFDNTGNILGEVIFTAENGSPLAEAIKSNPELAKQIEELMKAVRQQIDQTRQKTIQDCLKALPRKFDITAKRTEQPMGETEIIYNEGHNDCLQVITNKLTGMK